MNSDSTTTPENITYQEMQSNPLPTRISYKTHISTYPGCPDYIDLIDQDGCVIGTIDNLLDAGLANLIVDAVNEKLQQAANQPQQNKAA